MQIFTRNQRQWSPRPIPDEEVAQFRAERERTGIGPNMSHASYLVNLATMKPEQEEKSVAAMVDEVRRAQSLGVEYLVFHPGSARDSDPATGMKLVAARLDRVIEEAGGDESVTILLENTAGQGATLGADFRQLGEMIGMCNYPHRLGVCIDTCHAFAAGYDYSTPEAYERMMDGLIAAVTVDKIRAFHINDSLRPFDSRKDRHAGIGEGEIGVEPLVHFLKDPRFVDHPATLETPEAEAAYKRELRLLRSLQTRS